MAYTAKSVANAFISLAKAKGGALTNMQVQKLVYISQGYSLALLDRPLFENHIHAWQWGPVIPKLYKALQKYGNGHVTELIPDAGGDIPVSTDEYSLIQNVWEAYGDFTGAQLSTLTHKPGTPWSETWANNKFGIIDPEIIAEHYRRLVEA